MIGIYKIENLVNHKIYIGQSVNIEERLKEHKRIAFRKNRPTYNYPLYKDIRIYGVENFMFDILIQCKKEDLNSLEKDFIIKYNSFKNGYNQTPGGDSTAYGNLSNRHILNEDDVYNIRMRYNNKEPRWLVYQDYKNHIPIDTFVHIWKGVTWKWCHPEVFTDENIEWHKRNLGDLSLVQATKLSEADVKEIRKEKKLDKKRKLVYNNYKDKISESAFNAIWYYQSWKGVE